LKYPKAVVLAHPECEEMLLKYAHVIGSTSRLIEEVQKNPATQFIIATESGIFHQMKKLRPEAELIQAPTQDEGCACNECPYMRLNTLEKIKISLIEKKYQIELPESLRKKALIPLERMMSITSGKSTQWPETFSND
ncbi:MAG TPA: quinolinate synthase NadA, partial [Pseudobdellovibrionaceae bacterium]|nr:quinolinate synthase NadA [Pseudobdellovibrionaceae bacterium]